LSDNVGKEGRGLFKDIMDMIQKPVASLSLDENRKPSPTETDSKERFYELGGSGTQSSVSLKQSRIDNQVALKAKIQCGYERIALRINANTKFVGFKKKVFKKFRLSGRKYHAIKFIDSDKNVIVVSTDYDFQDIVSNATSRNLHFLVK
jgi:hypothetical protein